MDEVFKEKIMSVGYTIDAGVKLEFHLTSHPIFRKLKTPKIIFADYIVEFGINGEISITFSCLGIKVKGRTINFDTKKVIPSENKTCSPIYLMDNKGLYFISHEKSWFLDLNNASDLFICNINLKYAEMDFLVDSFGYVNKHDFSKSYKYQLITQKGYSGDSEQLLFRYMVTLSTLNSTIQKDNNSDVNTKCNDCRSTTEKIILL